MAFDFFRARSGRRTAFRLTLARGARLRDRGRGVSGRSLGSRGNGVCQFAERYPKSGRLAEAGLFQAQAQFKQGKFAEAIALLDARRGKAGARPATRWPPQISPV